MQSINQSKLIEIEWLSIINKIQKYLKRESNNYEYNMNKE